MLSYLCPQVLSPSYFGVWTVTWSPDGKRIASGDGDHTVRVWDAHTGQSFFVFQGHSGYVHIAAWSPDGKYIASGGYDRSIQVWNASTGDIVMSY
jgi:WD40 repeat protein